MMPIATEVISTANEVVPATDEVILTENQSIIFTDSERRLLLLFYSGTAANTIDTLRQALSDMFDPEDRAAAESLISKLSGFDEAIIADVISESEGIFIG